MKIKLSLKALSRTAGARKPGYHQAILAVATQKPGEEGFLRISDKDYIRIRDTYFQPEKPEPEYANIPTKGLRLLAALTHAILTGFEVRTHAERSEIQKICQACEYWRGEGNLGLGQCTAPGCGCSKFKWWLKSSRCTLGWW